MQVILAGYYFFPEAVHREEGADGEEVEPVAEADGQPGQNGRECCQLSGETNRALQSTIITQGPGTGW